VPVVQASSRGYGGILGKALAQSDVRESPRPLMCWVLHLRRGRVWTCQASFCASRTAAKWRWRCVFPDALRPIRESPRLVSKSCTPAAPASPLRSHCSHATSRTLCAVAVPTLLRTPCSEHHAGGGQFGALRRGGHDRRGLRRGADAARRDRGRDRIGAGCVACAEPALLQKYKPDDAWRL